MLKFYFNGSPNPTKVALFLEESGLPYQGIPVDPRRGEQFAPAYLAINPNGKVPAIVDGDVTVFDINAILLYLAEKTQTLLAENTPAARGELLSWLMFVATGVGPYSGQAVHFNNFAPEPVPYAQSRYAYEARRHYGILDTRLTNRRYILGDVYTIVDMAAWGWARALPLILGNDPFAGLTHVKRWFDEISARPAAQRASTLRDRHPFKTEMDDEARRHMFRHIHAA